MIKVLLVDDHDLVRAGIMRLLGDFPDIEIVGECATGEDAVKLSQTLQPDVVLMDLHMPGMGGMEAAKRILDRYKGVGVIALTAESQTPITRHAIKAGISGYITKGCNVNEMVNAIRSVKAGNRHIAAGVAQKLALSMISGDESPLDRLSKRELEVLIRISHGQANRDIAEQLHLSPKTISTYRTRLLEKLEVKNDVELSRICRQFNLVSNPANDD